MTPQQGLLLLFGLTIVGFLVADLGYFNRRPQKISLRSALIQSGFWVAVAVIYAFLIFLFIGRETAAAFMSAYVTEKMLSVDNLFVILLIFNFFKLEEQYHHRTLFWGILGAVVFRALFIFVGGVIISRFHWVLYVFGALLVYTGIKLLFEKKEEHADYHNSRVLRMARRFLPVSSNHHGGKFFVREHSKVYVTMLFMILLLVEATDIVFAVDSIPAAFAISTDSFVVFTSNIYAVMGLRALFFLIENVLRTFHHLQKGLSFVLVFIGAKMLADIVGIQLTSLISFSIIMAALGASLLLSVLYPKRI